MKTFKLKVTGSKSVRFSGERLARVEPNWDYDESEELRLYRTAGGKYVVWSIMSGDYVDGGPDVRTVHIFDSTAEVVEHLGQTRIAHALYEAAGIDNVEDIE